MFLEGMHLLEVVGQEQDTQCYGCIDALQETFIFGKTHTQKAI